MRLTRPERVTFSSGSMRAPCEEVTFGSEFVPKASCGMESLTTPCEAVTFLPESVSAPRVEATSAPSPERALRGGDLQLRVS